MSADGMRLLDKYRLCREFGWTPEEYDGMKYHDREVIRKIHNAIMSKEASNMKLRGRM